MINFYVKLDIFILYPVHLHAARLRYHKDDFFSILAQSIMISIIILSCSCLYFVSFSVAYHKSF